MKSYLDIIYDPQFEKDCKLDLYCPDEKTTGKVLIYFHGGGLEGGDKVDLMDCARFLTEQGISFVSANYRLYPEAVFPDYVEDAAKAVAWVHQTNLLNEITEIYIGGSSAGAYLSMMLAFNKQYLIRYGLDSNLIRGYVFDAGQPTTHFRVLAERGLDGRLIRVDEAAPIYYIDSSSVEKEQSPKFLIYVADHDMVNRLEQNYMLKRTMIHFGYDENKIEMHLMKGYEHCQYTGNQEFLDIMISFLNS